jgi:glycosyltransferase involved in cell wall biosynthesis
MESPPMGERLLNGAAWPKISIVTPSYNQGQFIEETIRSVVLQGYPNLEYIVMDGGSKDGTLDILRKYEDAIDFWASAPDEGQAAAINKGIATASGEILAWLNSDDTYESGVISTVAKTFQQHPDAVRRQFGPTYLRHADVIHEHGIYLPNHPGLSESDISYVVREFQRVAVPLNTPFHSKNYTLVIRSPVGIGHRTGVNSGSPSPRDPSATRL